MFNLSFGEILLLAVIGLIVVGPKQLPQVVKIVARTINEFKRAFNDVTSTVKSEMKTDLLTKQIKKTFLEDSPDVKKDDGENKTS